MYLAACSTPKDTGVKSGIYWSFCMAGNISFFVPISQLSPWFSNMLGSIIAFCIIKFLPAVFPLLWSIICRVRPLMVVGMEPTAFSSLCWPVSLLSPFFIYSRPRYRYDRSLHLEDPYSHSRKGRQRRCHDSLQERQEELCQPLHSFGCCLQAPRLPQDALHPTFHLC